MQARGQNQRANTAGIKQNNQAMSKTKQNIKTNKN
jgi:hypothetical protein